ncbi:heterokaryon incompatibility protein-domain-containing protein [Podospora conica]|nr:heterokaryon incompatibility protein-domain-containing protein [Schizothecium conicum]
MASLLPKPDPGHSCQECAPLNLDALFLFRSKAVNAGPVTHFIGSSCPLARLICLALDIHCGQAWVTLSQQQRTSTTTPAIPEPNVLLRCRSRDNPFQYAEQAAPFKRVMMALDSQPSWARPITYDGATLRDWVDDPPYIFGELECVERHCLSDSTWWTRNYGRKMRRHSIKPAVDARLFRTWLDTCKDHNHIAASHCAGSEAIWDGKGFRLIDVQLGCLVHVTERHEYLALSYPWGETTRAALCATTSNIDALCQSGSLDIDAVKKHQGKTPSRTVLDAMHLTRDTGFRYLWVDALCILQDDPEERRRLIHGMGGIYETATCTIICAAGTNADSGISGVWNTARQRLPYDEPVTLQHPRFGSYSVMIARPSLHWEIRRSHWNTRGWTYQELCLSSRSLFFTAGEVFFSCLFCHKREAYELCDRPSHNPENLHVDTEVNTSPVWKGRPHSSMGHFRSLPFDPDGVNYFVYTTVVQEYTKRELTLSSDIINAFQGIFNRFIDPGKTYLTLVHEAQCIPPRFLHLALLWFPISGSARSCSSSVATDPSKFSSWSWTSWHGSVTFIPTHSARRQFTIPDDYPWSLADPEWLGSLILASGLPQPPLPSPGPFTNLLSSMATTSMWELSLISRDALQWPEEIVQSPGSPRSPNGTGVLELVVPVLPGSAIHLSRSSFPSWWTSSLSVDEEEDSPRRRVWFRFDQDTGPVTHLHSYLALAVSCGGTVGVVGVVENDDGRTFRRVGVGWMELDFGRGESWVRKMGVWTLRRMLLR